MKNNPIGLLLVVGDDLLLSCCQRLDAFVEMGRFVCRDGRFSAPGSDASSDVCPFCGARNLLRHNMDGTPREDPSTCRRDLQEYLDGLGERASGVMDVGNDHMRSNGGIVDTMTGGLGSMYSGMRLKADMFKRAIEALERAGY